MDLYKSSNWKDIYKLRFNIEKCKILENESWNIKIE